MQTARNLIVKKIPDGYSRSPTAMTWAVVEVGIYEDFVLDSGFSTKRDALAWLARFLAA
jgi:hypothetical protein